MDRSTVARIEEHRQQSLADAVNIKQQSNRKPKKPKKPKQRKPKASTKAVRPKSHLRRYGGRNNQHTIFKDLPRCAATTAAGLRCKSAGVRDGFCSAHDPEGKFQKNLQKKRKKTNRRRDEYRNEYLFSKHWLDFKSTYYSTHPRECACCHSTGRIDLHHKTYAHVGAESEHDVVPLCRDHHGEVHAYHQAHPGLSLAVATDQWLQTETLVSAE